MGMCWVPDCNHHSAKDSCQFYRIPKYPGVKEAWTAAIGRINVQPNKDSRVCSCHFVDGNKHSLPCIFKRNADEAHKHLWKTPKIITRKPAREFRTTPPHLCAQAISTISTPVRLNPRLTTYFLPTNVPLSPQVQSSTHEQKCTRSTGRIATVSRQVPNAPTQTAEQSIEKNSPHASQQTEEDMTVKKAENSNRLSTAEDQPQDPSFIAKTEYHVPEILVKTEDQNSNNTADHTPDPAFIVKTEYHTTETLSVKIEDQNSETLETPLFSVKTGHILEPTFSLKTQDQTSDLAFSVKIEDTTSEPELIIPDIIPKPSVSNESEEKPDVKKVRVVNWSRTWLSD